MNMHSRSWLVGALLATGFAALGAGLAWADEPATPAPPKRLYLLGQQRVTALSLSSTEASYESKETLELDKGVGLVRCGGSLCIATIVD
jgi:hypothetical protein